MNTPYWLNSAWMWSCAGESVAFHRATRHVQRTQQSILARILRRNRTSSYGCRYRFADIENVSSYQANVPIVDYEGLGEEIERIVQGESGVLTSEPVRLLEPTGGSSSAEKLIPYTDSLRMEYQRALAIWVWDVMRHLPDVRRGRAYWSISPAIKQSLKSQGGIPIGFADDREYLGRWQRWVVSQLLVIPPQIRLLGSLRNARYATLLHLLRAADLTLISVWSPTFLIALVRELEANWESLCQDLARGQIRWPENPSNQSMPPLAIPRSDRRAKELAAIFKSSGTLSDKLAACWPELVLISCWADASSSWYVPSLRQLFPRVRLQPKGLLATEGVVSVPLLSRCDNALAIRSHFFEFAPMSDCLAEATCDRLALAHELETDRHYRVYLTTGGGLYRYDLGDEIQVTGWVNDCPTVRFVGRCHAISDLVGEKLNEQHVRQSIEVATASMGVSFRFALLAPTASTPAYYCLFLECELELSVTRQQQLAQAIDRELKQNPQYRLAVNAGQLQGVQIRLQLRDSWQLYERILTRRGQKPGDIKPVALDSWTGWETAFADHRLRLSS